MGTTKVETRSAPEGEADRRGFSALQLIPVACLLGGLLLIGSESLQTFVIENLEGEAIDRVGAAGRHFFALGLLGLLGIAATLVAVAAGSRPAAIVVAVAGLTALAIFAAVDLPDAGARDLIIDPNEDFVEGRAVAAGGFWTSLIGGLIMSVGGILLAALNGEQLRSLVPSSLRSRGHRNNE